MVPTLLALANPEHTGLPHTRRCAAGRRRGGALPYEPLPRRSCVPETRDGPPAHNADWRTSGGSGAPDQPQDEEQDDGSDDRHDEAADAPLEIGPTSGEESKQETAQEGPDDADDDVLQPALLPVGSCDHAGHPSRQRSEDDPGNDAEAAVHSGPPLTY